jgi:hypothetical protein
VRWGLLSAAQRTADCLITGGTRMRRATSWRAAFCTAAAIAAVSGASAQGVTSGSIRGSVKSADESPLDGAVVSVTNTATGFGTETRVHRQRFILLGLELGGPYILEVRRIGFSPFRSEPLYLVLGEPVEIDVVLAPVAVPLERVGVTASASRLRGAASATVVPGPLIQGLPTLNRNFYDFIVLAPQVSTKIGFGRSGVSAAGGNLRFNNYLVNGADERFVNGSVSAGHNLGKSVPIEAVREYEVLVAPYDVRYGDFAGALINTVTRSGTNDLQASAFAYWLNDRLARNGTATGANYERGQYGFVLSGPLIADRVHFLLAPEFQRHTEPAVGPYLGQPGPPVVNAAELSRLQHALEGGYGLTAGSAGRVINETPQRNVFARLDASIPRFNSRLVAFGTWMGRRRESFARSAFSDTFALSSYKFASDVGLRLSALQVHTDLLQLGGHNELNLSTSSDWADQLPGVRQPVVRVRIPATAGGPAVIATGSPEQAHGIFRRSRSVKLRDEVTLPWAARRLLTLGVQLEHFSVRPGGLNGAYGSWTFSSIEALEAGNAERYELRKDFGSASTALRGWQYAAYASDEWRLTDRLSLTSGVRVDAMSIAGRAPYNASIDSVFGRRTDEMPRARLHLSPRAGFTWHVGGDERDRIRGGVGLFTGRPPLAWILPALANHGAGNGVLRCGFLPGDHGIPPAFAPDYRNPPTQCATGPALEDAPDGDVDLLDRNLRLAQALRMSLAYDRPLPLGVVLTLEVMSTRYVSDFMFRNINLPPPRGSDRFGRVIYGTININGVTDSVARSRFPQVMELTNTSRNRSRQISLRAERRPVSGIGGVAAYTWSRTHDVQSPSRVNQRGLFMWGDARALSGRHDDQTLAPSLNDLPHRVVLGATYTRPSARWPTAFGFYYLGESGSPFTYVATGADRRRGDLNADGSNLNDPIYVPRNAFDPAEIQFQAYDTVTTESQAAAFERFVEKSDCLRRQRGRILSRNSCREPWSHTTVASVRQTVPIGRRGVEVELDVFNVLNLLNSSSGLYRVAQPRLLSHVAQTGSDVMTSQPIFRFDTSRPEWETLPTESAFQLQLAVRYRF